MYKKIFLANFGNGESEHLFKSQLINSCERLKVSSEAFHTKDCFIEIGVESVQEARIWHNGMVLPIEHENYYFIRLAVQRPIVSLFAWILQKRGIHYTDPIHMHHAAMTEKGFQIVMLAEHGLTVPHTIVAPAETFLGQIEHIEKRINYPFVFKGWRGQGKAVWLVNNREELLDIYQALPSTDAELVTIQEVIPNTYDVRALFFNGGLIGAMRRSGDDFLNNVSQGGSAMKDTLSPVEEALCQQAIQACELDFAGVDFIRTEQGIYFLEVNKAPQIKGLAAAHGGLLVSDKVITTLLEGEDAQGKVRVIVKEFIKKAAQMGIEHTSLGKATYMLHGKDREIMFVEALPQTTPATSVTLCKYKDIGARVLSNWGFNVLPSIMYSTSELAQDFLQQHKRVVVKPRDGLHGRGVVTNIDTADSLQVAIAYAKRKSKAGNVLLEKQFDGSDYRVLVVGKEEVFVLKKVPASIIGDGKHTIKELIMIENERRLNGSLGAYYKQIQVTPYTDIFLRRSGDSLVSIPVLGKEVFLTDIANISQGGVVIDYTNNIAPHLKDVAINIAKKMGMDVLGLDIMTQDISDQSQPYIILEMNAYPGVFGHLYPHQGKGHDVVSSIIKYMFDLPPISV